MKNIKKTISSVTITFLKKMKVMIQILFSSTSIFEQTVGDNKIILISSKKANNDLLNFISDKDALIKALNTNIKRKYHLEVRNKAKASAHVQKKRITIKVTPTPPSKNVK